MARFDRQKVGFLLQTIQEIKLEIYFFYILFELAN